MAKRRSGNKFLSGLGEGISNASSLLLRSSLQERQQDRYDQRQAANAQAVDERALSAQINSAERAIDEKVAAGTLEPAQAEAMKQRLRGQPASGEDIRPSPRRRMEKAVGEGIESATTPEGVYSPESIFGLAEAQGVQSRLPAEWSEGMIPAENDPFQNATPLVREYGERAGAKRRSLQSAPTERFEVEDPDGSKRVQFGNRYDGPVTTTPTAQQQGDIEGTKDIAKNKKVLGDDDLTTLTGTTQARIQNMVENLTRGAKVQTAAATAGATKRAGLAPDIIASEVDRSKQLAAGKENSTESERRAATNWAPLVKAHATALALESSGARIGTGDNLMTKVPLLNRAVSPQTQQYMQSARDFISTLGLIRSGVTVRPDEAESLFSTMFGTTGDDPRSLRNKQQSREVFLASMQAMVGRSGDEAGRMLASAINQGQIPLAVVTSLQFDNQELLQAMLANLKNVPKFDAGGNPINLSKQ